MTIIFPDQEIVARVIELAAGLPVKAQEIYDVQLVATMLGSGVTSVYTYNQDHFRRFKGIEVLTP